MAGTNGNGKPALKGLSAEFIKELQAKQRNRGEYGTLMLKFMDSDEAAIDVKEAFPSIAGKDATTLYQGFLNAAKKANLVAETDPTIKISKLDDTVYLFHNERVEAL